MIDPAFEPLRSVGLTPAQAAALARFCEATPGQPWRVVEVHRDAIVLHDGLRPAGATLLPRLLRELAEADTPIAVGDWVLAGAEPDGGLRVHARLPPLTHLARRDGDGRRHALASNVDTALLVMGLDDDFNLRRLERYLSLVLGGGVRPVVVLTKADVAGPAVVESRVQALRARIPAGLDVVAVNGTQPAAAHALAPHLHAGQTLVLLGSSGAGKSTLTNTLLAATVQDTGAVRGHDSRGKHTTTSRSLHQLPGGACVIDTPGLRALRADIDEAAVAATFADIGELAGRCRFRDCQHAAEPGCAVREGVSTDRLRNYEKLLREARRDTMSLLERQQQVAQWKARTRAGRQRSRDKRGDG
jgi:ribosome biogenesis GTPase